MFRKYCFLLWMFGLMIAALILAYQVLNRTTSVLTFAYPGSTQPLRRLPAPEILSETQAKAAAALLASTVRLEIDGAGISHGTVMNGRYLVTHNHFSSNMTAYPAEGRVFSLYRTDGRPLINHSPLTKIAVVAEDQKMLVLDFGEFEGQGYFDLLGVPSAAFDTSTQLAAGAEVAQLNWDGYVAHIDWIIVREVREERGVAILVLDNALQPGASGGGIFYGGRHIANNWSTNHIEEVFSGEVVDAYSVAMLNSQMLFNDQFARKENYSDQLFTRSAEEAITSIKECPQTSNHISGSIC
ncbi:MAG: hypothetical protein QNJ45_23840 [Ardenticatenaceae bacterium]|nr:hypothetical protein [Ardenticatenaceae bacterium]